MTKVGERERTTQQRVVKLFTAALGYDYLGDWTDRVGNRNIDEDLLRKFLREKQGYDEVFVTRALHLLDKAAGDTSKSFCDRNRDVYDGADLIARLNATTPWLICSLVHKFGGKEDGEEVGDIAGYIEEVKNALLAGFSAKGNLFVFVDECHRTQSGDLHEAMKAILPTAVFIGFTGTPLLRADKKKSIEVFGGYIHTYRFDEAVKDKVVLDLRYEARDIDQRITSQARIDQSFEAKTKGLTDLAKAQLKQRWGTMRKVLSSQSRLEQIVADILMDTATRDRLSSGHGNAMLVAGSIYEACKFYDLFDKTDLKGKCAIVTSYQPSSSDIKGEESGEGDTDNIEKYNTYRQMLADWCNEAPEKAVNRVEEFETAVKKKFIKEPGQMKLLIVVDKLLTGLIGPAAAAYPRTLDTPAKRALYDNLGKSETLARRAKPTKPAIPASASVGRDQPDVYSTNAEGQEIEAIVDGILTLVKNQHEY